MSKSGQKMAFKVINILNFEQQTGKTNTAATVATLKLFEPLPQFSPKQLPSLKQP